MTRVSIDVKPRPYDAAIGSGIVADLAEEIESALGRKPSKTFVITVPPVKKHWLGKISSSLKEAGFEHELLEFADGESNKTMRTVETLTARLIKAGADRQSLILALGGGVAGDVAGFVASIYMRGIDVIQIPTSFLAQVDASIGGKTGVNLSAGKNLVGTFHQPRLVLIDPEVLATLPEREFRSGLYEALKCGVIRDRNIFEFMEQKREMVLSRDPATLEWLITECVRVKAKVVAADEFEGGERRILNFGHTIGHALEAETSYKQFLHGEAVAWGMVGAAMIAAAMQKSDGETARRIIGTVLAYAPLPKVQSRSKNVIKRLRSDKKTRNGHVHFVLPLQIGEVEIVSDVPDRAVQQAVEEIRYLSQL
jgi:3-dehydroquinate synthase